MMMKEKIIKKIEDIIKTLQKNDTWVDFEVPKITVERPTHMSHGDWTTNIAFTLAKDLHKAPQQIAEELAKELKKENIENEVSAIGGYINITLPRYYFTKEIEKVLVQKEEYGNNKKSKGKRAIVEYSSPNIAKPFTIGHFRSTIIGDAIAHIMEANGYDVIRDNHLGDWGTQFGKLSLAVKRWGDEDKIAAAENPVKELVALYIRFHDEAEKDPSLEDEGRAWFARLENGDKEVIDLWEKCIAWSMIEFERIYKRLNVSFDTMLGEAFFQDKMDVVIKDLQEKKLLKESEGAQLVFFDDENMPPLMIKKSDGTTLYATRDLATDRYRKEKYNPDIIINEVGAEQTQYFKQLFEVEELLGYFKKNQRVHVAHGLFQLKEGKMSTRKGNVIWLEDVLERAAKEAQKMGASESMADDIGIGALKFNDLKREAQKTVSFDWKEILTIKGDSGPYIQYTHARCHSIIGKAQKIGITPSLTTVCDDTLQIERIIAQFGETIERASKEYAPHYIAQYLIELAHAFNAYYAQHTIIDKENKEKSAYRVLVATATAHVLKNGLHLLGIKSPEKM